MLPSFQFDSRLFARHDLGGVMDDNDDISPTTTQPATPIETSNPSARSTSRFANPAMSLESKSFWQKSVGVHPNRMDETGSTYYNTPGRPYVGCTRRTASMDSGREEDHSSPLHLFCRPSSIQGWPHPKQNQHRHSNPNLRLSFPRTPKRKLTARTSGVSEGSNRSSRSILPRQIKSRGRLSFLRGLDETPEPAETLNGVGENEILVKMEVEVYNEMAQPGDCLMPPHSPAISSLWNDPSEQRSFTSTWRDHQHGHTTKDAFLGKRASTASTADSAKSQTRRSVLITDSTIPSTTTIASTSQAVVAPPLPPIRRSSKDKGPRKVKSLHITTRSKNELEGVNDDQRLNFNGKDRLSGATSANKRSPSGPTQADDNVLKITRILEGITQIEAMIPSKSKRQTEGDGRPRTPQRKSSRQKRRPSKTLQPAGQPPERPLPDLPVKRDEKKIPLILSRASPSKAPEQRVSDTSKFSSSPRSVSTLEIPSPTTPTDDTAPLLELNGNDDDKKPVCGLSIDVSGDVQRDRPPVAPGHIRAISSGDETPAEHIIMRNRKTKIATDRGEKIRELKRKHMAAITKSRRQAGRKPDYTNAKPSLEVSSRIQSISRSTQTTEHIQPSSPPRPQPVKYPTSSTALIRSKRESLDELDQFPAVPLSRPGSRASVAPTIPTLRSAAKLGSSPRKARPRGRTIHVRYSLNQEANCGGRQSLTHSVIYINVDTDPISSIFRAGTIGRSLSKSHGKSKSSSSLPAVEKKKTATADNKAAASPKASPVSKKQSSRSLRSQASTTRNLARHGLERVSPAPFSRPGLLSSDEYSDREAPPRERFPLGRAGSKSSNKSRASRKDKETTVPQLPITGQFAMEHVLMALAKCQNQGIDINNLSPDDVEKLAHQQKIEDELDSRAAKRLSATQRPQKSSSAKVDDQSRLVKVNLRRPRPMSDLSITTVTATDTDASTYRMSDGYSPFEKRTSAGSLTDPTDGELHDMFSSMSPVAAKASADSTRLVRGRRRPSSPTLSNRAFSYYQAQSNDRQAPFPDRASRTFMMFPPVAPPRTTSRTQPDTVDSSPSTMSCNEVFDLDKTSTSDPFMLGMLEGMATWTNPVVDENMWRTWGDQGRVIEGKALFTPPKTTVASVSVP